MRTPFDHLGKKIGQEAFGRFGPTAVQHAILPETQYADLLHEPDRRATPTGATSASWASSCRRGA
jgi:hypothetical protein